MIKRHNDHDDDDDDDVIKRQTGTSLAQRAPNLSSKLMVYQATRIEMLSFLAKLMRNKTLFPYLRKRRFFPAQQAASAQHLSSCLMTFALFSPRVFPRRSRSSVIVAMSSFLCRDLFVAQYAWHGLSYPLASSSANSDYCRGCV